MPAKMSIRRNCVKKMTVKKEKGKKALKAVKASATIEASFLIPFIIIIIVLCIYMSFYLYNREQLAVVTYCSALRGSQLEQDTLEEQYKKAGSSADYLAMENLLGIGAFGRQIKVTGDYVEVAVSYHQEIPIQIIPDYFKNASSWDFEFKRKVKKLNPVDFIRTCRKVEMLKNKVMEEKGQGEDK